MHSYSEEEYHQALEDIVSEANWLERIVMKMLHLSRIEQGALKLETELYPIEEIVLYTLDLGHMRSLIQGRDIIKDIPEGLPAVELDPEPYQSGISEFLLKTLFAILQRIRPLKSG